MIEYIVEKKQTSGGWTWAEKKGKLIRCKDCKYYKGERFSNNCKLLEIYGTHGYHLHDKDYCSKAVGKKDND